MALIKSIENVFGTAFDYHRISRVEILADAKQGVQLRMTVESYADKETRKSGKQPTRTVNIINDATFALVPFYELLKTKFKQFNGAEDDFKDEWKGHIDKKASYTVQTAQGEYVDSYGE